MVFTDNVNHAIKLSLSLIGDYTEELSDPESQEYWDLKIDATTTVCAIHLSSCKQYIISTTWQSSIYDVSVPAGWYITIKLCI